MFPARVIVSALGFLVSGALGSSLPSSKSCSLAAQAEIKAQVKHYVYFCEQYASLSRVRTPIVGQAATDTLAACQCILTANNVRPAKASHQTTLSPGEQHSCNQIAFNALKLDMTTPVAFCSFFGTNPRSYSFIPGLSVVQVAQACACITDTTMVSQTRTTAAPKKPTASSKPHTTTTKTISSSRTKDYILSSGMTLARPPAVTLRPYVPIEIDRTDHGLLKPANSSNVYYGGKSNATSAVLGNMQFGLVHPSLNLDLSSLVSSVKCNTAKNTLTVVFKNTAAFTTVQSSWKSEGELILISSDTSCETTGQATMFLAASYAFHASSTTVVVSGKIVRVKDVFNKLNFDFGTISLPGNSTNTASSVTVDCGALPAKPLSQTANCGVNFDSALDTRLGFYSGDEYDVETVFAILAPGFTSAKRKRDAGKDAQTRQAPTPTTEPHNQRTRATPKSITPARTARSGGSLASANAMPATTPESIWGRPAAALGRRSWFGKLTSKFKSITSDVKADVKSVETAVYNAMPPVIKSAVQDVSAAVNVIKQVADEVNAATSHTFTKSFHVPMDISIPEIMLTSSPWGEQLLIMILLSTSGTKANHKRFNELAETGPVEHFMDPLQLMNEIRMYCVNCGMSGSFELTGSVAVGALGFSDASISLSGNLAATIMLGIYANGNRVKEYEMQLLTLPLSPLVIPEVINVGPEVTFGISMTFQANIIGELLMGGTLTWPAISAKLDFSKPQNSYATGFSPHFSKFFEANATVTLSAALGLPVEIGIGIDILDGTFKEDVGLRNTPSIEFDLIDSIDLTVGGQSSNGLTLNGGSCDGTEWTLGLVDTVEFEVQRVITLVLYQTTFATLATGCALVEGATSPSATSTAPVLATILTTSTSLTSTTTSRKTTTLSSATRQVATTSSIPSTTARGTTLSSSKSSSTSNTSSSSTAVITKTSSSTTVTVSSATTSSMYTSVTIATTTPKAVVTSTTTQAVPQCLSDAPTAIIRSGSATFTRQAVASGSFAYQTSYIASTYWVPSKAYTDAVSTCASWAYSHQTEAPMFFNLANLTAYDEWYCAIWEDTPTNQPDMIEDDRTYGCSWIYHDDSIVEGSNTVDCDGSVSTQTADQGAATFTRVSMVSGFEVSSVSPKASTWWVPDKPYTDAVSSCASLAQAQQASLPMYFNLVNLTDYVEWYCQVWEDAPNSSFQLDENWNRYGCSWVYLDA